MPTIMALPYLFWKIIKIKRAFWKYGQHLKSSRFSHSWRTNKQTNLFWFLPRVVKAFVPELTKATFVCAVHARKTEICRFALGSALHVCKRQEVKKGFSKVSQRDGYICKATSWTDLHNQGTICKSVLCSRESMAESIECAPAKLSPAKGDVSKHLRKHPVRSGLT